MVNIPIRVNSPFVLMFNCSPQMYNFVWILVDPFCLFHVSGVTFCVLHTIKLIISIKIKFRYACATKECYLRDFIGFSHVIELFSYTLSLHIYQVSGVQLKENVSIFVMSSKPLQKLHWTSLLSDLNITCVLSGKNCLELPWLECNFSLTGNKPC